MTRSDVLVKLMAPGWPVLRIGLEGFAVTCLRCPVCAALVPAESPELRTLHTEWHLSLVREP